jgi:hypothetical protein
MKHLGKVLVNERAIKTSPLISHNKLHGGQSMGLFISQVPEIWILDEKQEHLYIKVVDILGWDSFSVRNIILNHGLENLTGHTRFLREK